MDRQRPLEGLYIVVLRDGPALMSVSAELTRLGAYVRAVDAPDVLGFLDEVLPDLIVVGFDDPREPAYQFIRDLRARVTRHGMTVPVLAVASRHETWARDGAEAGGFDVYMAGPVDLEHLREVVERLVDRSDREL
jgi:CheY-like chemotaxis protein